MIENGSTALNVVTLEPPYGGILVFEQQITDAEREEIITGLRRGKDRGGPIVVFGARYIEPDEVAALRAALKESQLANTEWARTYEQLREDANRLAPLWADYSCNVSINGIVVRCHPCDIDKLIELGIGATEMERQ